MAASPLARNQVGSPHPAGAGSGGRLVFVGFDVDAGRTDLVAKKKTGRERGHAYTVKHGPCIPRAQIPDPMLCHPTP